MVLAYDVDNDVVLLVVLPDRLEMLLQASSYLKKLHKLTTSIYLLLLVFLICKHVSRFRIRGSINLLYRSGS
jgi:hypothetical protein